MRGNQVQKAYFHYLATVGSACLMCIILPSEESWSVLPGNMHMVWGACGGSLVCLV